MANTTDALVEAAQAVVARWDSPKWKDEAPTADAINTLRAALALARAEQAEPVPSKPCRVNPQYRGPSNCNYGTVGCTEAEHRTTPPAPVPQPVQVEPDGWVYLTDEDRTKAFDSLPDMLDGFLKKWGWLHFAKAIEDICREKNAAPPPPKREPPDWLEYDPHSDVLTIHGKRYAAGMFGEAGFLSPVGTLLRVAAGQPEVVTLETVKREPLTRDEIVNATDEIDPSKPGYFIEIARNIEAAHGITPKERNHD